MDSNYDVKKILVPTIINDSIDSVKNYIQNLGTKNILKAVLEAGIKKNQATGKLSASLNKNNDNTGIISIEFGFLYPYYIWTEVDGKKEEKGNCLAAIVLSSVYVPDTNNVDGVKSTLINPVLAKASQLTYDITAEALAVPMGVSFNLEKDNNKK